MAMFGAFSDVYLVEILLEYGAMGGNSMWSIAIVMFSKSHWIISSQLLPALIAYAVYIVNTNNEQQIVMIVNTLFMRVN